MRVIRLSYPTDMSNEQWELLSQLLPSTQSLGRPLSVNYGAIFNAIFYLVVAGLAWRMLPQDFSQMENRLT